jgi:dimethylargininase
MYFRAIVRTPGPDFDQGLTTASFGRPSFALLLEQHAAYVRALRSIGLEVVVLDAAPGFPDAYFVEDAAVVTPEVAVITRPGAPSRQGEAALIEPVLTRYRQTVRIKFPGTLDGGDVQAIEKRFFIGLSDRTNAEGATQLRRILAAHQYACTTISVKGGLHLKSSVNWLGGENLVVTEEYAGHEAFQHFRKIVLFPGEEYAANTLWINDHLLTPAGFPSVRAKLAGLGLPVIELETSEFRKMDGGLTCLSLRF